MACGRRYGRRRSPSVEGAALWDCAELVVCDQCWHLAGGTAAITSRLVADGEAVAPELVFDPVVEAVLAAAAEYDELHPIDRLLVESGVRWEVLRHIAVPARMQLAGTVLRRPPAPDATRSADSARVWLDHVEARIRAQTGPNSAAGVGFVYNAKRRRWWRIANLLACAADRDTRPLTWATQEELAAAVGCSTRTVRRAVAWLRTEGLLWEIVPGCRLPQQHSPDGETATEAATRRARLTAAVAAEDAAIARARARSATARAELGAVTAGHAGPAAQIALPDDVLTALETEPPTKTDPALVNLSPVYELRIPTEPLPPPHRHKPGLLYTSA
ncbi:MAG: helix-turn-helix domain-containing protein, partial [Pseudonocardia sp.]|nr:helix-turn-helix domain-containing protein [Pseudonocardia sp.]